MIFSVTWNDHDHSPLRFRSLSIDLPVISELECLSLESDFRAGRIRLSLKSGNVNDSISANASSRKPPFWLAWWLQGFFFLTQRRLRCQAQLVLILPSESGFVVRNDAAEQRLAGCPNTTMFFSACDPGQSVLAMSIVNDHSLCGTFDSALFGMIWEHDQNGLGHYDLLSTLDSCLNVPLVIDRPFVRRRVAVVEGGFSIEFRKHIFAAALALGIDLIVLDQHDHRLRIPGQRPTSVVDFVSVDLSVDKGLPERLFHAVKACRPPVDGLTTFSDRYLCATSEAACSLGLPTSPLEAFKSTVDKRKMRQLNPLVLDNAQTYGTTDLSVGPKLIVKPAQGGGSANVFLTTTEQERRTAEAYIHGLGKDPVVEEYIDGPEVDINIVLHNGSALFSDISDKFPTTAEGFPAHGSSCSWIETGSVFQSGLPASELTELRHDILTCLQNAGFQTGVFHCEAKVVRSCCRYKMWKSQLPELTPVGKPSGSPPATVATIEINARAPGCKASEESKYALGVDFYALQLLAACSDDARFAALSNPFSKQSGWWGSGYIIADMGGTFVATVTFEKLMEHRPELMKNVVEWTVFYGNGDRIKDPAETGTFQ